MTKVGDTIFEDDNAFFNLLDIIEGGQTEFVLVTETTECIFPAKLALGNNGLFEVSFKVPETMIDKISSEYFSTHHVFLQVKDLNILIQNKHILNYRESHHKNADTEILLTIDAFGEGLNDAIWNRSKQVAFCSYSKHDYYANDTGVLFELTTSKNQSSSWKNCVKLEAEGMVFLLYFLTTDNGRNYLVLKSQKEVSHDLFLNVLDSCKIALGLISGYLIADNVWYLSVLPNEHKSLSFRYERIDESIDNQHPLLDCGLYKNCPKNERMLSAEQFEKLMLLFYNCKEIRRASQLLIQAGNVKGVSKGCLAAVALETIKKKIIDNPQTKSIIADEEVRCNLKNELANVINSYKSKIDKSVFEKLVSKLNQIDQQSNAEQLKTPFEELGIKLSKVEEYCFNSRNAYLHGSTIKPTNLYKGLDESELNNMVSNRLIMLTTMLLLNKCGYEGKVVDWGYTEVIKSRGIENRVDFCNVGNAFRDMRG